MRSLLITLVLSLLMVPYMAACAPETSETVAEGTADNDIVEDVTADLGADTQAEPEAEALPPVDPATLPEVPAEFADAFKVDDDDPFVTASEVEDALEAGLDLQFIDARPALDYEFGHVPGAISVVYSEADQFDASTLPTDRWMVVYCECPYAEARQTYDALRSQGLGNVRVFEEGLAGWRDVLGRDLVQSPASSEG